MMSRRVLFLMFVPRTEGHGRVRDEFLSHGRSVLDGGYSSLWSRMQFQVLSTAQDFADEGIWLRCNFSRIWFQEARQVT